MKKLFLVWHITCLLTPLTAQSEMVQELMTELLTERGATIEESEMIDQINDLIINPIQINTCIKQELASSGLFTPFQVYGIMQYREKYGPYLSIVELAAIPGLSENFLKLIEPLLGFSMDSEFTGRKVSKGMLLSNVSVKYPLPGTAADLSNPEFYPYTGSPVKYTHRFKYTHGNYELAFAYDKDEGESLMNIGRPEHLCGYLAINQNKVLDRLIIGNFKIHRGLGLVNGVGFTTRGSGVNLGGYRTSYSRPFASTMEYDYYRGVYSSFKTGKILTDAYVSYRPTDISLFRFNIEDDLFNQVRKSGYHRTETEREGFGLANHFSSGFSATMIRSRSNFGIAYSGSSLSFSSRGNDSLQLLDSPRWTKNSFTVYALSFGKRYELYCEAAMDIPFASAIIAGGNIEINPALNIYASLRNYQAGFRGQYASGYGASSGGNERGFNFGAVLIPFEKCGIYLDSDLSGPVLPVNENIIEPLKLYNRMRISYEILHQSIIELRLSNSLANLQKTGINTETPFTRKNGLQLKYRHPISKYLSIESRLAYSFFNSGKDIESGNAFYLQLASGAGKKFRFKYRFLVFNSEEWENRIYIYEPGLRYSFLFPGWHGKGTQNILILIAEPSPRLTLRTKFALTQYAHRRSTGSGIQARKGDSVYNLEFQLQVALW